MTSRDFRVEVASPKDAAFLREMARHAATLEDRPLPAADAEDVLELIPPEVKHALVAVSTGGRQLGALRLYMKCGFRVAGAGRGWFGVAMSCCTREQVVQAIQ